MSDDDTIISTCLFAAAFLFLVHAHFERILTLMPPRRAPTTPADDGHVNIIEPDDRADTIGDIVAAVEHQLDTDTRVTVTLDFTHCRLEDDSARAIHVHLPIDGRLTDNEAHWLAVDVNAAADVARRLRELTGHDQ